MRTLFLGLFAVLLCPGAQSQPTYPPASRDDIVSSRLIEESFPLQYPVLHDQDIFWQKRLWRVIDTREKQNLPFRFEERPLYTILLEAGRDGEITLYDPLDDRFQKPLSIDEAEDLGVWVDTLVLHHPEDFEELSLTIVEGEMNPLRITRYRIKEVWYFNKATSRMEVRILGIAPIRDLLDDNGNFLYEQLMFWVYYPEIRAVLSREPVFNPGNEAGRMSWADLFDTRMFSSYIMKEVNIQNLRVEDYFLGEDVQLEAERIKVELFNFEHDLWSY